MSSIVRVNKVVQNNLAGYYYKRQVELVHMASNMASRYRREIEADVRPLVELLAHEGTKGIAEVEEILRRVLLLWINKLRDNLINFGKIAWTKSVDALLAGLPKNTVLAMLNQPLLREDKRQYELGKLFRLLPIDKISQLPQDKIADQVRQLIFPQPDEDTIRQWLYVGQPGGRSWEERLAYWADQTRRAMLNELSQGLAAGETPDQLETRLRPLVGGIGYKSERIARTEAMRMAERANREMFARVDHMLAGYGIMAVQDEWTRPHHAARHGRVYWKSSDGTYKDDSGQLLPDLPDEPNCRCMTLPVFDVERSQLDWREVMEIQKYNTWRITLQYTHLFTDWWTTATEKQRKIAVGAKRYTLAQARLGRAPEWYELLDVDGQLVPIEKLVNETDAEFTRRVEEVRGYLFKQELVHLGTLRTSFLPARLPGVTRAEEALRVLGSIIHTEPKEYLFTVDEDGTVVYAIAGEEKMVRFGEAEADRFKGMYSIHNHPDKHGFARPLSLVDVLGAIANKLKEKRAVGYGRVHKLRCRGNYDDPQKVAWLEKVITDKYEAHLNRLRQEIWAMTKPPDMTDEEWDKVLEEIWWKKFVQIWEDPEWRKPEFGLEFEVASL